MELKVVPAVYEAGKLRPLVPLNLNEHERVDVAIVRLTSSDDVSDDVYMPQLVSEPDSDVTLEAVQEALAKIPGSLVEDFSRARDERF